MNNVDYEKAFDLTGHGTFSSLATMACSLIYIHAILEMVAVAYTITPAECDLKLSVSEKSWINAAIFIGLMVTSIPWGILGDKFGRRRILLPALLCAVAASFASSLCSSFWFMFMFRLLTGIMVSATSSLALVYLGEMQDSKHRDRSITTAITAAQVAFIILPAVAWIIIPRTFSISLGVFNIRPWRVLMWTWGVVGLSGAAILLFLPESPRFINATQGPSSVLPKLAEIYTRNYGRNAPPYPVESIAAAAEVTEMSLLLQLQQMMKAPLRKCVLLSHAAMFNVCLLSNGLYIWVPDFLNAAVSSIGEFITVCTLIHNRFYAPHFDWGIIFDIHYESHSATLSCSGGEVNWIVYPTFIVLEILFLIPFVVVLVFINRCRKVRLYAMVTWVTSSSFALSAVVPQCLLALILFVAGLGCACCSCVLASLIVDAFPTSLRGLATCTMFMAGHLGAVIGTNLVGFLLSWTCYIVILGEAAFCVGVAASVVLFWPNVHEVRKEMESRNFVY